MKRSALCVSAALLLCLVLLPGQARASTQVTQLWSYGTTGSSLARVAISSDGNYTVAIHSSPASSEHVTYFASDDQLYAFGSELEPLSLDVVPQYFVTEPNDPVTLITTVTASGIPLSNKAITWCVSENGQRQENVITYTNSQGKATFTYTALVSSAPASVTIQASFSGDEQFAENSASSSGVVVEKLPRLKQGLYGVGTELSYNCYHNENLVGQYVCRVPGTEIRDGAEYLKVLVDSWENTGYENSRSNTTAYVRWAGEQMEYGYLENRSNYENVVIRADYDYTSRVITLSGVRNAGNVARYTASMNGGPFPGELWLFEFSTGRMVGKQVLLPSYTISGGEFGHRPYLLNVENTEAVTVPAGSFECYRLTDELGAGWWVTVDGGMLVKYQGGSTTLELTSYKLPAPESAPPRIVAVAALIGMVVYLAGMAKLLSASNRLGSGGAGTVGRKRMALTFTQKIKGR